MNIKRVSNDDDGTMTFVNLDQVTAVHVNRAGEEKRCEVKIDFTDRGYVTLIDGDAERFISHLAHREQLERRRVWIEETELLAKELKER